jgi:hypothetical protein
LTMWSCRSSAWWASWLTVSASARFFNKCQRSATWIASGAPAQSTINSHFSPDQLSTWAFSS